MEIENHKEEVPFAHYEALFKDLNPQEVLERLPDVGFDGGAFHVTLLGRGFSITYPGCEFSAKAAICRASRGYNSAFSRGKRIS